MTLPPFGEWITGFALEPEEDDTSEDMSLLADLVADRIMARLDQRAADAADRER